MFSPCAFPSARPTFAPPRTHILRHGAIQPPLAQTTVQMRTHPGPRAGESPGSAVRRATADGRRSRRTAHGSKTLCVLHSCVNAQTLTCVGTCWHMHASACQHGQQHGRTCTNKRNRNQQHGRACTNKRIRNHRLMPKNTHMRKRSKLVARRLFSFLRWHVSKHTSFCTMPRLLN